MRGKTLPISLYCWERKGRCAVRGAARTRDLVLLSKNLRAERRVFYEKCDFSFTNQVETSGRIAVSEKRRGAKEKKKKKKENLRSLVEGDNRRREEAMGGRTRCANRLLELNRFHRRKKMAGLPRSSRRSSKSLPRAEEERRKQKIEEKINRLGRRERTG